MKSRISRLMVIRKLIAQRRIRSQEELAQKLEGRGFEVTQATLSRDLKFLKVTRRYDEKGELYYFLPGLNPSGTPPGLRTATSDEGFVSLEFSDRLGVIKTLPGYASSIAIRIDRAEKYEILGTIAGDDTILLVPREGATVKDIRAGLKLIFPRLAEKL